MPTPFRPSAPAHLPQMAVGDQVRMLAALACLGALLTVAPRTVAHLLAPAAAPVAPGTLGAARGPVAAVPARGTADPSGVTGGSQVESPYTIPRSAFCWLGFDLSKLSVGM